MVIKKTALILLNFILLLLIVSCSDIFGPYHISKDNNGNSNENNDEENTGGSSKKTMYFEFRFDGEAVENYTYRNEYGGGVKDIMFQLSEAYGGYTFLGYGSKGFDNTWWFSTMGGKTLDIPFYIGNELLKKEYYIGDTTVTIFPRIDLGMASSSGDVLQIFNGVVVYKEPFTATLKDYNQNIHTNVAQFHVHFYQIEKELYPNAGKSNYTIECAITFNGFKKK